MPRFVSIFISLVASLYISTAIMIEMMRRTTPGSTERPVAILMYEAQKTWYIPIAWVVFIFAFSIIIQFVLGAFNRRAT